MLIPMAGTSPSRWVEESPSAQPFAAGRILVLCGDGNTVNAITGMLAPNGFAVLAAATLSAAMEILGADSAIDLVLYDIGQRPNLLSSTMEQLAGQPSVGYMQPAIVLLTSAEHVPHALEAMQLGAYDYVAQPCREEHLLPAVRRAVEHRRLRVQNEFFKNHLEQLITARTRMLQGTMQQLEQSYDITLEALGNALDLKDAETEGHSKRVTAYTLALGRAVGLSEPQLRMVGRGAFLHDIGKMAIPDVILRKPGKLTEEERTIMRTHSELGYHMIRKIPYLREAAEIVYAHQECFDGSGYPRGLRGEEIPMGARIFALADTLDAITSNRPYRQANTIAAARKEVLRCAGTQFDPALVDVFLATPDSIWQDLREGIMRDGAEFSPFGYTFGKIS